MASGTEGWRFFDVESGRIPDESWPSALPAGGRGRVVVLAATPFAREDAWASNAAVLIAEEWAREGLRIFLMDLGLEEPSLHDVLGLPNGEGVSEAFLFGASVQHIAKPAMDNAIFFAPAGAPPADPEEVLGHARWNDLAGGFSEAQATLLLFLPTDIPGAGKILSRATDILFLAGRGESADEHLGPASIKVVSILGPLGTPPAAGSASGSPGAPPSPEEAGAPESEPEVEEGPPERTDAHRESSDLDFEGTFELAEGFILARAGDEEDRPDAELDVEGAGPPGGALSTGLPSEDSLSEPDEALLTRDSEIEEEAGTFGAGEVEPGFGDDLQMGASLADTDAPGGEEAGVEAEVEGGRPDFEAHFVDLPPAGEHGEDVSLEGEFGQDLVQGPDFGYLGDQGQEEVEGPVKAPEAPPGPAPQRPAREVLLPERRRPPRRKAPKKKIPWGRIGMALLVAAVLGSAAGTAMGFFSVPGFGFLRSYFTEIPDPPLTLAGPQANEEVLRYSLVLFEYDEEELEDGLAMLSALEARLPQLLLTLVPGEVDGRRVNTLLAGPAVDRVEAENLRAPIAEVLVREDPASWSVRETPRAFYLGERGTLEEAQEYRSSVVPEALHAYILHVTFPEPEGSESYQVLTGAFAGVQDARPLQLILRDLGFRDAPLIERRGRLPE